jgi:hypothetical protein
MNPRPAGLRLVIAFLALTAAGTTLYWIVFFTSGAVHVRDDAIYLAFEKAFLLADTWMAACALLGAVGLWRRWSSGFLFGLLAASSMIFLGCMDVLFNLNEGNYSIGSASVAVEIVINVALLAGGTLLIAYLWRQRRALLATDD